MCWRTHFVVLTASKLTSWPHQGRIGLVFRIESRDVSRTHSAHRRARSWRSALLYDLTHSLRFGRMHGGRTCCVPTAGTAIGVFRSVRRKSWGWGFWCSLSGFGDISGRRTGRIGATRRSSRSWQTIDRVVGRHTSYRMRLWKRFRGWRRVRHWLCRYSWHNSLMLRRTRSVS